MGEDEEERMHLDVLVEDRFAEIVADGLRPTVVVGSSPDRVNLGIESGDGSVSIYLGDLSPAAARSLGSLLQGAANEAEDGSTGSRRTWALDEANDDEYRGDDE